MADAARAVAAPSPDGDGADPRGVALGIPHHRGVVPPLPGVAEPGDAAAAGDVVRALPVREVIGASAAEQRRRAGELLVEVGDLLRDDAGRPVEVAQGGGALGDEHHHPVGVLAELRLQLLGVSELVAQVVAFAQQRLLARPDGAAQPHRR